MPRAIAISPPPMLAGDAAETPVTTRVTRKILHVPLLAKLIGANVAMLAIAIAAAFYAHSASSGTGTYTAILTIALMAGTTVNALLTFTALRPIRDIENIIVRVWHGDPVSRFASSVVGDPDLDRIGFTLNSLLDRLEHDRKTMQDLAENVVVAEEREHRRIAGALHESVAQSLASVTYMLTALAAKSTDLATAERVMEIRRLVGDVLDEVDVLSHTIHPSILSDLGLAAGLRSLALAVSKPDTPVTVRLEGCTDDDLRYLGPQTASALFRITQEAVQNALRHSAATQVGIVVEARGPELVLRIRDNGHGFAIDDAEKRRPRKGLFLMRQRAKLINATLRVESAHEHGTSIEVAMPASVTSFNPGT